MRALLTEGAPSAVLLALSPWILPLIAITAKRKAYDDGRCARVLRTWLRIESSAGDAKPEDAARHHAAMNKRIKARLDSIRRD